MEQLKSAIAFFVFNRPDTTRQVFEAIRAVRPRQLLIVSDGCRPDRPEDVANCDQVKQIVSAVDWDCQIKTNFSPTNLGCSLRFATGLDWVFQQVDEAIILEDDCLPDRSFFRFCEALLEKYRSVPQVTQICGTNRLYEWQSDRQSYHFAHYGSAWGWATWRRAWQHYDHERRQWQNPAVRESIRALIDDPQQFEYFTKTCEIDMWDYKWAFAQLSHQGLTVIPALNLVKNIGFSGQATHTKGMSITHVNSTFAPAAMDFPLVSPPELKADREYDRQHFELSLGRPSAACAGQMATRLSQSGNAIAAYVTIGYLLKLYPQSDAIGKAHTHTLARLRQKR